MIIFIPPQGDYDPDMRKAIALAISITILLMFVVLPIWHYFSPPESFSDRLRREMGWDKPKVEKTTPLAKETVISYIV